MQKRESKVKLCKPAVNEHRKQKTCANLVKNLESRDERGREIGDVFGFERAERLLEPQNVLIVRLKVKRKLGQSSTTSNSTALT